METHGEFFADKLMDLANLAVAALVFGQQAGDQPVQQPLMLAGFAFFFLCFVVSYVLRKVWREDKT